MRKSDMKISHDRKSRIGQSFMAEHVMGTSKRLSVCSSDRSLQRLLPHCASQCHILLPSCNESSKGRHSKLDSAINRMNKIGERVDSFAQRILEHVKLRSKLTETVKEKLRLGAKILQAGRVAKVFNQNFCATESERLLKASHCYLSTTAGPIAGILFISSEKIAFRSDKSIKVHSPSGKLLRVRYKVLIPLTKIKRANGSENVNKPSEKYLQVVTEDKFEFWFMGFLNRQRILNIVNVAILQAQ